MVLQAVATLREFIAAYQSRFWGIVSERAMLDDALRERTDLLNHFA